jgi:iron complex transport system ATP-binding protein
MNLQVKDLSFMYPSNPVLTDVKMSVGRNECVVILGTNGVGKSTLLKCMNRILRYQKGGVEICGDDIYSLSRNELAKRVGYVSQSSRFSETTVFDAILLGRKPYIKWDITDDDLKLVQDIMARLSLSHYAMRMVNHLSGGETQKVAIARALAQQPEILLFDEPTSNLDLKNQLEVIGLIKSIVKEGNVSAVVTMHDLNLALRFADKFIMMKDKKIYAAGGSEILTAQNIKAVYGVDVVIETYKGKLVVIPH